MIVNYNHTLYIFLLAFKYFITLRKLKYFITLRKFATSDKGKRKAFLDLLLDQNAKDDTPLTDDELRAQVDTFMFEVRCPK